jgi:heme-degrading monooxygenase HmoA
MVVSITRLRVRRWWYLPAFVLTAIRSAKQAAAAEGNLAAALLRDRNRVFWTATAWASDAALKAFMHTPPHGPAMRKLLEWCDEASLVRWAQETAALPSWDEAHRRLQQDGRPSKVNHPSDAHTAFRVPPPAVGARATTRLR